MARGLYLVLVAKIVITIVMWSGPLLLLCGGDLIALGFPEQPMIFLRLLGLGYASLLVSYAFGVAAVRRSEYPVGGIWTGIVSNGGACLVLVLGAVVGSWAQWGWWAQVYMKTSLVLTFGITVGLLLTGPLARHAAVSGPHARG